MVDWTVDFKALDAITPSVVASGHSTFATHMYGRNDQDHAKYLLSMLNAPRGGRVVDMGCGVGEVSRWMKIYRPDLYFTLVNLSRKQLEMCPPSLDGFIRLYADATNTRLTAAYYDRVMFNTALVQMDKTQALREACRILKPGGRVMLSECLRISGDNGEWTPLLQGYVPTYRELEQAAFDAGLFIESGVNAPGDDRFFRRLLDEMDKGYLLDSVEPWILILGKK